MVEQPTEVRSRPHWPAKRRSDINRRIQSAVSQGVKTIQANSTSCLTTCLRKQHQRLLDRCLINLIRHRHTRCRKPILIQRTIINLILIQGTIIKQILIQRRLQMMETRFDLYSYLEISQINVHIRTSLVVTGKFDPYPHISGTVQTACIPLGSTWINERNHLTPSPSFKKSTNDGCLPSSECVDLSRRQPTMGSYPPVQKRSKDCANEFVPRDPALVSCIQRPESIWSRIPQLTFS